MITSGQLALLILSIVLFSAGAVLGLVRLGPATAGLRLPVRIFVWHGIIAALVVLIWHAAVRTTGNWLPLEDNFEAFLWLAILLAIFVVYVQLTRPVSGLDWFILPLVILLLVLAAVLGKTQARSYGNTAVSWVHRVTAFAGALAFTIAGATGAMYLLASRRLRSKSHRPGPPLGNLERLEHLTFNAATLGFALMTIGLVAGIIWQLREESGGKQTILGPRWWATPKVLLATAVWLIYGLILHSRITPILRGRKVAILSIIGCLLTVATLVALNMIPTGGPR